MGSALGNNRAATADRFGGVYPTSTIRHLLIERMEKQR
jgi:hypothetical protein